MNNDQRAERIKHLETACIIAAGFLLLSFLLKVRVLMPMSFLIIVLAVFSRRAASSVHFLWMTLAKALGYVNSWALLFVIYYIFLVPIAGIKKLIESLSKKENQRADSSFVTVHRTFTPEDFKRMW